MGQETSLGEGSGGGGWGGRENAGDPIPQLLMAGWWREVEGGRAGRHWCVCVCVEGGTGDVFTWNHSPSDTRDSSEPGGEKHSQAWLRCSLSAVCAWWGGWPPGPARGGDGSQVSPATGSLGGGVGGSPRPAVLPDVGPVGGVAGLLALPCNGWAPPWAGGGSPLPAGTHAERRVQVGGGAVTLPSLAWAAASPKCFTGKPLRAGSAADATGYLLTVIKSLANGFGRKNSHDDDLSWAPISDLSYAGMCFPDPRAPDPCPSAGEQSRGSSGPVGGWGAGGGW